MNGKQWTIILAIVSTLTVFTIYGLENRPIVGYSLKDDYTTKEIGASYNGIFSKDFQLQISNSGKTDAALILHFFCENATISTETKKPYYDIMENEMYIHFTVNKDYPRYYAGNDLKIKVEINEDADSFSCGYEVLKNRNDKSISGIINIFFGEIKGYYPTSLKYEKINDKFILQE